MSHLLDYPYAQPIIWHVCFHKEKRWWGGKYSHVSLIGAAEDTWVHFDLHRRGVSVGTIYRYDEVQFFLEFMLENHDIVKFGAANALGRNFGWPMTCVGFVKHVLGIRSCALRPDALFKCLLRTHNGVLINDTEGYGE